MLCAHDSEGASRENSYFLLGYCRARLHRERYGGGKELRRVGEEVSRQESRGREEYRDRVRIAGRGIGSAGKLISKLNFIFLKLIFAARMPQDRLPRPRTTPTITSPSKCAYKHSKRNWRAFYGMLLGWFSITRSRVQQQIVLAKR